VPHRARPGGAGAHEPLDGRASRAVGLRPGPRGGGRARGHRRDRRRLRAPGASRDARHHRGADAAGRDRPATRGRLTARRPPMRALYFATVSLHVLAAMFWLGGMFFLGIVGAPALRRVEPPELRQRLFSTLGLRFRALGWGAVGVLLATGVLSLRL